MCTDTPQRYLRRILILDFKQKNAGRPFSFQNRFSLLWQPCSGEFKFGFRSPIGLRVGQAESIPQNWADIQKSEFYEEWLNAMRLELDEHIGIGTFSADVVPNGVDVITGKWVFAWKTDSDGYITKAKARLIASGFGQQLGVDYFKTFEPTQPCHLLKWHTQSRCRMTGRYTILMLSKLLFR